MASCGKDVTHEYLLELVGARYHVVVVVYIRLNEGQAITNNNLKKSVCVCVCVCLCVCMREISERLY